AAGLLAAAPIRIGTYADTIDLTITDLSGYDMILGMSWLHHYNPAIDWRGAAISLTDSAGRRHRLLKAPTGAATWRPADHKTNASSINLISAKRLRRAYAQKQISFACVVYVQEVSAAMTLQTKTPNPHPPSITQQPPGKPRITHSRAAASTGSLLSKELDSLCFARVGASRTVRCDSQPPSAVFSLLSEVHHKLSPTDPIAFQHPPTTPVDNHAAERGDRGRQTSQSGVIVPQSHSGAT